MQAFFIFFSRRPAAIAIRFRNSGLQEAAMPEGIVRYTVSGLDDRDIWRGLLGSGQLFTTVARTGSFGGIVLALGENRGAREAAMRFRLTFICREPSCDKTAVVLYDARPGETVQQFRQRNPIFLAVLCGAKHAGNYPASTAVDITVPARRTKTTA
jgi:hypothetical protein